MIASETRTKRDAGASTVCGKNLDTKVKAGSQMPAIQPINPIDVEPESEVVKIHLPAEIWPPRRIGITISRGTPFSAMAPTVVSMINQP